MIRYELPYPPSTNGLFFNASRDRASGAIRPKQKIRSAGFAKKPARTPKQSLPQPALYRANRDGE